MDRELKVTVKIKEDENYKKYLEAMENAKRKIEAMKESGTIKIGEVFMAGVECGMGCKDLNMEVI